MNVRKLAILMVMVLSLIMIAGTASADGSQPQGTESTNWQNPIGGLVPKPDVYIHSVTFFQIPNRAWYTKIQVGNKGNKATHVIAVRVTDAQGDRIEYITGLVVSEVK